jgi:IS5 family transposase
MSLSKDQQEELFTAINELPGFLPEDDPMMVFSREIYPVFKDEDFENCYSTKGRNAISPAFLACVTLLQFRENLSDPETSDAVIRRLDWKIALHLRLRANVSFDSSTLCYYRRRLKENDKMSLVFDKIVGLAQEKGFIRRKTNQRVDATHIISHVNRIATTDLLFRAVRCLVEEIEKNDPGYYETEIPEYIKERYSKRFSSFGMSKDKKADKLAEIVEDGLYLRALLASRPSSLADLRQLAIMDTIFEENVKIGTKEIEEKLFVEVEEIWSPKQTIFDPRDPSVKLSKKGKTRWVGSKCHIVETAEKGKINFITNMVYQRANEDDSRVHGQVREENKRRGLHPEKLYADSKYISGAAIREYRENGQELMGYMQGERSKKPEGFQLKRFDVNMDALKARCPAGKENSTVNFLKDGSIRFLFSRANCKDCAFYKKCVGENKLKVRTLSVSPDYNYTIERRKEQDTDTFQHEMSVRAQVEGTISEGVRFCGLRYARYKGEAGHRFQFYMTGAALNVKRLINALTKGIEIPRKTSMAYQT